VLGDVVIMKDRAKKAAAAEAAILRVARVAVPSARAESLYTKGVFSCTIVVRSDDEKQQINENAGLINDMIKAGAEAGCRPDFLTAQSQETVDRRWKGDWNFVFR
jgi:hypothetical protein